MTDLEKSEYIIAKILDKLIHNGVRNESIGVGEFELDPESYDLNLILDAMNWLKNEGIIRYSDSIPDNSGPVFSSCVITAYGFSLFGQKLAGHDKTVGQAVHAVSANEAQYAKAGNFVGGLLGALTKALS